VPHDYAAVKFYTGPALPDTPTNRARVHALVRALAARMPVVMLDTAWSVDDHSDYAIEGIPNVTTLRPALDPRTNLDVQTRAIAGARVFMGTCGGLAWLAPLLGVDTIAVYDDDRFLQSHLYAARYAYRRTAAARFSTLNLKAAEAIQPASLDRLG
jgi:ADP-heptose:LPS heptosyltransferase